MRTKHIFHLLTCLTACTMAVLLLFGSMQMVYASTQSAVEEQLDRIRNGSSSTPTPTVVPSEEQIQEQIDRIRNGPSPTPTPLPKKREADSSGNFKSGNVTVPVGEAKWKSYGGSSVKAESTVSDSHSSMYKAYFYYHEGDKVLTQEVHYYFDSATLNGNDAAKAITDTVIDTMKSSAAVNAGLDTVKIEYTGSSYKQTSKGFQSVEIRRGLDEGTSVSSKYCDGIIDISTDDYLQDQDYLTVTGDPAADPNANVTNGVEKEAEEQADDGSGSLMEAFTNFLKELANELLTMISNPLILVISGLMDVVTHDFLVLISPNPFPFLQMVSGNGVDLLKSFTQIGIGLTLLACIISAMLTLLGGFTCRREDTLSMLAGWVGAMVMTFCIYYVFNTIVKWALSLWKWFVQIGNTSFRENALYELYNRVPVAERLFPMNILYFVVMFAILLQTFRLFGEIITRYLTMSVIYLFAPFITWTLAIEEFRQSFWEYIKLFMSEVFVVAVNALFLYFINQMMVNGESFITQQRGFQAREGAIFGPDSLMYFIYFMMVLGTVILAQKVDEIMRAAGFTVARTGGQLYQSMMGAAGLAIGGAMMATRAGSAVARAGEGMKADANAAQLDAMYAASVGDSPEGNSILNRMRGGPQEPSNVRQMESALKDNNLLSGPDSLRTQSTLYNNRGMSKSPIMQHMPREMDPLKAGRIVGAARVGGANGPTVGSHGAVEASWDNGSASGRYTIRNTNPYTGTLTGSVATGKLSLDRQSAESVPVTDAGGNQFYMTPDKGSSIAGASVHDLAGRDYGNRIDVADYNAHSGNVLSATQMSAITGVPSNNIRASYDANGAANGPVGAGQFYLKANENGSVGVYTQATGGQPVAFMSSDRKALDTIVSRSGIANRADGSRNYDQIPVISHTQVGLNQIHVMPMQMNGIEVSNDMIQRMNRVAQNLNPEP